MAQQGEMKKTLGLTGGGVTHFPTFKYNATIGFCA